MNEVTRLLINMMLPHLSERDQKRFAQCLNCSRNIEECGCTDDDEDENGSCRYYIPSVNS
jgi:hypothetical protein